MSLRSLETLVSAASVLAMSVSVHAAISYQYTAGGSSYTVSPGQSITVPLYLHEILTGGDTSLIGANGGLYAGGFAVIRSGTVPSSPAALTAIAGDLTTFSGGFFAPDTMSMTSSFMRGAIAAGSTYPSPDANGLISLGTVTIQGGTIAGQTSSFMVQPYGISNATVTNLPLPFGYDLDSTNNGTTAGPPTYAGATAMVYTVTTVPEPVSLAVLGLVPLLGLRRRACVI